MHKRHVLVVEDDAAVRRGIVDALEFHGFATSQADTGTSGMEMAQTMQVDLVLLDLVLPGRDGLEVLKGVRETRPTLPVIVLTARGDEADRVRGLKLGADDYVIKPFSIKELLARVEAVLRRSPQRQLDVKRLRMSDGVIDLVRREIRFDNGDRGELTDLEAEFLRYLVCNSGRAIAREELLTAIWRIEARGGETRTIDMHIARLREKLRDDPSHPRILVTVRGKGYMIGDGVTTDHEPE